MAKNRIVGVPIVSLQTGAEIAQTEEPIIDPRYLRIHAFYCKGRQLDTSPAVLHVDDIREVGALGFIVDSAERLMAPQDLVRLKEIIDFRFRLDDKPVTDEAGQKLGRVTNYTIDTTTFYITQLGVSPTFWRALATTETLIHRSQVVQITNKVIIVKTTAQTEEAAPIAKPLVDNPFLRSPRPQPGITSSDQVPL